LRRERGCLHAETYQDVENKDAFLVIEQWATQKDTDDHLGSDIFTVLRGAGSLMRRPPEVVVHTVGRSSSPKA
jgi:quinol monooxygenase YgiN